MEGIGLNSQKFKVLFINRLVFLDSAAFLNSGLSSLVDTLVASGHDFKLIKQWKAMQFTRPEYLVSERFKEEELSQHGRRRRQQRDEEEEEGEVGRYVWANAGDPHRSDILDERTVPAANVLSSKWFTYLDDEEQAARLELVKRKGVMAYDFVQGGASQLWEQKELPSREDFFNVLTQEDCSAEDYEHAQKVWDSFGCGNFLDYSMVYNIADVYLLAEAVMDMRHRVFDYFGLDLTNFFSFPHLSKQLLLKVRKEELIRNANVVVYLGFSFLVAYGGRAGIHERSRNGRYGSKQYSRGPGVLFAKVGPSAHKERGR